MAVKQYKIKDTDILVDAIQLKLQNMGQIENFVGGDMGSGGPGVGLVVATREGALRCTIGDFVVKQHDGTYYTVNPNDFEQFYEEVPVDE